MAQKKVDYRGLNAELEEILVRLQREDIGVDEALQAYERGQKIVAELKQYLEQAENKVSKLQNPEK